MKFLLVLFSTLFILSSYCQSPEADQRRQRVETSLAPEIIYGDSLPHLTLETQMNTYGIKGVSIAVIKDYKIDWAKGYGWADEKEQRPVTTDTRFQAASISKSLNSLGIMKLAQEGKLALDTDINIYLKSWQFPYDIAARNKTITLRNLLTHTAGLSVHGFGGYEPGDTIPTIIQVLNGERPANSPKVRSQFEPSKKFQYSGGGTTISQLIIMDITGMPYEEYMQKNVLNPLGMTNSSYAQPSHINPEYLATGYYESGQPVKGKYHIYPEQAAAGLWTTPTDLSKYIIETQLAYEGRSSKVLSPELTRQRLIPYIDSSAALGSFLLNKGGITWFSHNGGNEGFVCTYYGSLKGGNGVVVMTNGALFGIIPEIVNSVAQVYEWKDFYTPVFKKIVNVPIDSLKAYAGKYLLIKDTLSFSFCDKSLCVQQNGQPADGYELIFNSMNSASIREVPNVTLTFLYNGEGKIETLEVNEGGGKTNCPRIK